jgi:hypothetical protein
LGGPKIGVEIDKEKSQKNSGFFSFYDCKYCLSVTTSRPFWSLEHHFYQY